MHIIFLYGKAGKGLGWFRKANSMETWVKLYRKFDEWEWFTNSDMVHLFIFCMIKANHKPKKWNGITIERGQFVTSLRSLNEATGIPIRKIRTGINRLKSTHELTSKATHQFTILTVCNYDSYQSVENESDTANDTVNDNQTTNERQQLKNVKNEKNKELKEYTSIPLSQIEAQYPNLNPEFIEIAKAFQTLFRNNLISAGASPKVADNMKGTSIDDIRLIIEADGYTVEDLRQVFDVLRTNDFWKRNVISTKTLRKQMTRLKLEKHGDDKRTGKTGANRDFHELAAIIHAVTADGDGNGD